MVTYLGTVEEYDYKNHTIEITQQHYSQNKQLTFVATVEGEHRFTNRDYAHDHEGFLGLMNLNIFRRCVNPDYKKKRVEKLKQKTEKQLDEKIRLAEKAEEMSL